MDAHDNEYLAAIAGMAEHTMPSALHRTYAVGDYVSGISGGKRWCGEIEFFTDDSRELCINLGGGWLYVPLQDVALERTAAKRS